MGEVYRATDTNLGRDVAIKILPPDVACDPERLTRFRREAQLLASLNHPNIAAIHGLEEADGKPFLVLELVEGEDLSERLKRGALPVDEALEIARQIAEAVEEAHEKGIVHRDLKPANVRLKPDGKVKVLDFGLAKLFGPPEADPPGAGMAPDLSRSPTLAYHGTAMGVILGTAAYMSPEQARGKTVDKRADIWAFGVVLFEMLTGQKLFAGELASDTLAAVLTREPDWNALPATTPWRAKEVLRRCLQRDPRARLRDIGDARLEVLASASDTDPADSRWPALGSSRQSPRKALIAGALGLTAGAAIATTIFLAKRTPAVSAPIVSRFAITLPSEAPFFVEAYPNSRLAISRDGSRIVYCAGDATGRLYLRRLDDLEVRPIPGTEGAFQPFFSPDGDWVAFFTQSGALKRVSLAGGNPVTVVSDLLNSYFVVGTWTDDDRMVFDTWNAGLRTVPADGGSVSTLTAPTSEWHQDPQALPGSGTVLYFAMTGAAQRIDALPLDGGEPKTILENASHPRYLASGHLLFMRDGNLMVVPFDAHRLEVKGPAASVALNVMVDSTGAAAPLPQLGVSLNGTLAYVPTRATENRETRFAWVDRSGNVTPIATVPIGLPAFFDLSPDGKHVAVASRSGSKIQLQLYDLESNALTGLVDHVQDFPSAPAWSPDGRRVVFARYGTHQGVVLSHELESSSLPEELVSIPGSYFSTNTISRDGRFLAFSLMDPKTNLDIWVLDLSAPAGKETARPFGNTRANEGAAAFSPNGRWIAFVSDESGSYEVYLRRFPGGESKKRVSNGGGFAPRWSSDGRELFFQADRGKKMMVTSVRAEPELSFVEPRLLFEGRFLSSNESSAAYAVAADGRFLMIQAEIPGIASELVVVQNWFGEIERLAPRTR